MYTFSVTNILRAKEALDVYEEAVRSGPFAEEDPRDPFPKPYEVAKFYPYAIEEPSFSHYIKYVKAEDALSLSVFKRVAEDLAAYFAVSSYLDSDQEMAITYESVLDGIRNARYMQDLYHVENLIEDLSLPTDQLRQSVEQARGSIGSP